jgi:hypothetical protein
MQIISLTLSRDYTIWFAQSSKLEGLLFYCSLKGKSIGVDGVLKLYHHKSDSL